MVNYTYVITDELYSMISKPGASSTHPFPKNKSHLLGPLHRLDGGRLRVVRRVLQHRLKEGRHSECGLLLLLLLLSIQLLFIYCSKWTRIYLKIH